MHERINSTIPVENYLFKLPWTFTVLVYLFKVNNVNTRTTVEICSKLRVKTPERLQWRCSFVFIVKFEQIRHIDLVFPIVDFEQLNAGCVILACLYCWIWTVMSCGIYFIYWNSFDFGLHFMYQFFFFCVHQM